MSEKDHLSLVKPASVERLLGCRCNECGQEMLGRFGDACHGLIPDCGGKLIPVAVREALEFYADPIRYEGPNHLAQPNERYKRGPYRMDAMSDRGALAMTALDQLTNKPKK